MPVNSPRCCLSPVAGVLLAALPAIPLVAHADAGVAHPELSRVFYEFEVAGYCGLVDNDVGQGFRAVARRLIQRDGLDGETVNRLRGEAWQAAHAEWQNRGLGGFKNWCRTEGLAAAERFQNEAPGASP